MSKSLSLSSCNPEIMLNNLELGSTGTIVVMICRMWDVSSAVGRYLGTEFIVSDREGNLMHCTAKANIAHNFFMLKEGWIYSVKNFSVVPNKEDFRIMRFADYMLEFDGDTSVRKSSMKSEGFDRYPFQIVEIGDLEPTNNKFLIDAVGYVTNVGRITQQRTGARTLDFYLANDRGQQVKVTCWGVLGDKLIEKRTRHVGLYPIVLTALSVKSYNNRLNLSSTSSSVIVDDEKIPLLRRLKTDPSGSAVTKEILPGDNTQPKDGTLENALMWARNKKYDTATFHCQVTIDRIRTKNGWNFPSCGNDKCKKGNLGRKAGQFWCESCESTVDYPLLRYRLELEVSDATAEVLVVMFDETATSLLGCSAASMLASQTQDADEHPGLPIGLANIVGTSRLLELKSHSYYEHATYESFTCWKIITNDGGDANSSSAKACPKSPVAGGLLEGNETENHERVDDPVVESSKCEKVASKVPKVTRLDPKTAITTPSKTTEGKKHTRGELEDSDTEISFVAESQPNEQGTGSVTGNRKTRRLVYAESD